MHTKILRQVAMMFVALLIISSSPSFLSSAANFDNVAAKGSEDILAAGDQLADQGLDSSIAISVDEAESYWELEGAAGFSEGAASSVSLDVYGGIPYVAYSDGISGKAVVKKYNADSDDWDSVGTPGFSADRADHMSFYIDEGIPYVAYQDVGNDAKVTVMKHTGDGVSGWEPVGSEGFSGGFVAYTSLYVYNGTPYVAYQDMDNEAKATVMKYTGEGATGWEPVGNEGFSNDAIAFTSLQVYGGIPHVAYSEMAIVGDQLLAQAQVMKFTGVGSTGWESVGDPGSVAPLAGYTSLHVDNGTPYLAYSDGLEFDGATVMKYTAAGASGWEPVGEPGFSADRADFTTLYMYNGTPYVVYQDLDKSMRATVMKYTGVGESGWEPVGIEGFTAGAVSEPALYVDEGVPYVAYSDDEVGYKITVMKRKSYTVTYDGNGSTGGSVPVDSHPYGPNVTVSVYGNSGDLIREGYTFVGWSKDVNGAGLLYTAGDTFTIGTDHVTLYAQWSINSYTVNFNSHGGATVSSQSVEHGNQATEPEAPTRTGYTFDGWYTDEALSNVFSFHTAITENMTLHAKWSEAADDPNQPSNPSSGSNSGGGGSPLASPVESVMIDVEASGQGAAVQLEITRSTNADGGKVDKVDFAIEKAAEAAEKASNAGASAVKIVIPDAKDEVDKVEVDLPVGALESVEELGLDLEIYTENGQITIPNRSLTEMDEDLYFDIVPLKKDEEWRQAAARAKEDETVRIALADGSLDVVGRPMTIETNMTGRQVQLTLPLDEELLPQDADERADFLADLAVFIEHSDGDRMLLRPEIGEYAEGKVGLSFTIEKFSTFTVLNMSNWSEHVEAQEEDLLEAAHQAYITGYSNGTFEPDRPLTRAEMAAMLSRVQSQSGRANEEVAYSDVTASYWALDEINGISRIGLMQGYPDGTFHPNKAITRAEMAVIVAQWLNIDRTSEHNFNDLQGHWAERVIVVVSTAGYMEGYPDGSFQPNKPLTRAEAVAVINRVLDRGPLHGVEQATFSDVPMSHWAFEIIEEAARDHHYSRRPEAGEAIVE